MEVVQTHLGLAAFGRSCRKLNTPREARAKAACASRSRKHVVYVTASHEWRLTADLLVDDKRKG
jgi:hypothetical protein